MMEKKQLTETIEIAIKQALANTHTLTIARITAVNESTVNCQPVINRVVNLSNGESLPLPELIDVPVIRMQGGESNEAWPIAEGDYALVFFNERCFDRWYSGQDEQPPAELRMHDYSDGFALVGINPLASQILNPTDGRITRKGDMLHIGDLELDGNLMVTGNVIAGGNVEAGGDVIADKDGTRISLLNHPHTGNLGNLTSPPVPQ